MENRFSGTDNYVKENEIGQVSHKVLVLADVLGVVDRDTVRSAIRKIFVDAGIKIRHKVTFGDDLWVGRSKVSGKVVVEVRVDREHASLKDRLLGVSGSVSDILTVIDVEVVRALDVRFVSDKYNRSLHVLEVALPDKVKKDSKLKKLNNFWHQHVSIWGESDRVRIEGSFVVTKELIDESTNTYRIYSDTPYGIEINEVMEKALGLPKQSLIDEEIKMVAVYEEIMNKGGYLTRKKCPVFGTPIEMTVGNQLVGDTSIRAMYVSE